MIKAFVLPVFYSLVIVGCVVYCYQIISNFIQSQRHPLETLQYVHVSISLPLSPSLFTFSSLFFHSPSISLPSPISFSSLSVFLRSSSICPCYFPLSLSLSQKLSNMSLLSLPPSLSLLSLLSLSLLSPSLSLSLSETLQYVSSLSICAMFQTKSYEAPGIAVFMNINASFVKCEMANVYDNGNDTEYVVLSFNQHKLFTLPHVT